MEEVMIIAASLRRKALVTVVAAGGFVSLHEVTMLDSHAPWGPGAVADVRPPAPGARLAVMATAYCKGLVTAAGVAAQSGVAASDPTLLPLGSIVELDGANEKYDGIYSVVDTGPAVQGPEIDLYMWSCHDALKFGRQQVRLTVLRVGWNPKATTQSFMQRLFRRYEPPREPDPLPSRPLPVFQPEASDLAEPVSLTEPASVPN
jgi:3D (Asp-Asp-Asp) domain-containing protein